MSWRTAGAWIALFVALALAGGVSGLLDRHGGRATDEGGRPLSAGRVVRVIDGDTVSVRFADGARMVRYIGVDTPETVKPGAPVQCFGRRASAFNRRLVGGRRVRLRFGPERVDRYGRLLAYVYPAGREHRSVSATLVARGYGRVLTIAPNTQHATPYARLEREARRKRLGLWGACTVNAGRPAEAQ